MDVNLSDLVFYIWFIDNERKDSKKLRVIGKRFKCIFIYVVFLINFDL